MDLQTIIVILIVAAAFILAARGIYKSLTGKSKCNCGCESCGMKNECNIGEKGR